jgi:hypothetical protein
MYRVNGVFPQYSASLYNLKAGDVVEWLYTRNLGRDIGGGYAGDGSAPAPATPATPGASAEVPAVVTGGAAVAQAREQDVKELAAQAVSDGKSGVVLSVTDSAGAASVELDLTVAAVNGLTKSGLTLTVETEKASLTFNAAALSGLAEGRGEGDLVRVVAADAAKTGGLSAKQQAKAGNNPVLDLTVWVGNTRVHDFKGEVAVRLPGRASGVSPADYDLLTVYYLDDDGNITEMRGASYDAASGKITFTADHFSKFFVSEWQNPFNDIAKGEWFYKSVRYAYSNGLMGGAAPGSFAPRTSLSRAMLVTILARDAGVDASGGATWYAKAVEWGKANGVTDGTDPNGGVTREQLAAMLYRYAGSPKPGGGLGAYTDAERVSVWARDAMAWAVAEGIVTGRGSATLLAPGLAATRGEAAVMLERFVKRAG